MKELYCKEGNLICEVKYSDKYFSNYSKHFHDRLNLDIIEEGTIQCEFKNKRIETLQKNQIAIFKPYEIHQTKSITELSTGYYSLYFSEFFLKKFDYKYFNNIIDDKELTLSLIDISNKVLEGKTAFLEDELNKVFKELTNKYQIKNENPKIINLQIEAIKEFIVENLDNNPSLELISNNFNLSKEHIVRIFKKELGLTPHSFITSYKINKAKNILSSKKIENISEVAQEVGFYDQSHFNKSFKRVFAVSPSEIIKK